MDLLHIKPLMNLKLISSTASHQFSCSFLCLLSWLWFKPLPDPRVHGGLFNRECRLLPYGNLFFCHDVTSSALYGLFYAVLSFCLPALFCRNSRTAFLMTWFLLKSSSRENCVRALSNSIGKRTVVAFISPWYDDAIKGGGSMKSRKTFTLRLEESMLSKLGYISAQNKRSINNQIEVLLEKFIEDFEKDNGKIPVDLEA